MKRKFFSKMLMVTFLFSSVFAFQQIAYADEQQDQQTVESQNSTDENTVGLEDVGLSSGYTPTMKKDVLVVGTYFANPPFEYYRGAQPRGFEVGLLLEIARRTGLHIKFANAYWEKLIPQLTENKYDLVIGAMTTKTNKEHGLVYSEPYFTTGYSIVLDKDNSANIKSVSDLKNQMVGVPPGNDRLVETLTKQYGFTNVKVIQSMDTKKSVKQLQKGEIVALVRLTPAACVLVQQNPGLKILDTIPGDQQSLVFVFNNNPALKNTFDKVINDMKEDGSFQEIYQRWFGDGQECHKLPS